MAAAADAAAATMSEAQRREVSHLRDREWFATRPAVGRRVPPDADNMCVHGGAPRMAVGCAIARGSGAGLWCLCKLPAPTTAKRVAWDEMMTPVILVMTQGKIKDDWKPEAFKP